MLYVYFLLLRHELCKLNAMIIFGQNDANQLMYSDIVSRM